LLSVIRGDLSVEEVDPDQLPALIAALADARDDGVCRRRTDDAEHSDRLLHLARRRYREVARLREQRARAGRVRERYECAVRELSDLKARLASEDAELRRANGERREALEAQQGMELESLQGIWRTPEKGRFFNRTSPLLRAMRRQTVLLLNDHRYQEMRRAEVLANQQEELEVDQSHHSMNAEYLYAQQLLRAKHERAMAVVVHAQDVRLAEHETRGRAELQVMEQRVANLKRKLDFCSDPEKVWALYGRNRYMESGVTGGVAHLQSPAAKNPHRLRLPGLMGPFSPRRRAASQRASLSIQSIWQES
jgi:hypothetical protein